VPETEAVELSIILTSRNPSAQLKRSLDRVLKAQRPRQEVIVSFCRQSDGYPVDWPLNYPGVTFIKSPVDTDLPMMLSEAIGRARGEIIAITDSGSIVAEDWCESILKAHTLTDAPVVGGTVEPERLTGLASWAAFFCDYAQFMLPAESRCIEAVPGNNISIKRRALRSGTEFVEDEFWKSLWCRHLRSEGVELVMEPAISVVSENRYRLLPLLLQRFRQARAFAGFSSRNDSFWRRSVYAARSLLLPPLFTVRVTSAVIRKRRSLGMLILSWPIIALIAIFWSAGETVGYAAGRLGNARKSSETMVSI